MATTCVWQGGGPAPLAVRAGPVHTGWVQAPRGGPSDVSFTVRVLLGLFAGLALGILIAGTDVAWLRVVPDIVEPVGLLFVNAIRMTVLPLVVASLIVGVASMGDAAAVGRLGARAIGLFLVAVGAATVFAAATSFPLLARLEIAPAVAASLREGATSAVPAAGQLPSLSRWIVDLVPVNVVATAATGTILPLVVFALLFGLSLTRVSRPQREAVLKLLQGVADAMLILVGWVLRLTPIGVFALAVPLFARMGLAAAGALVYYIVLLSLVSIAFIAVVLYPAAVFVGRVPLGRFARACAPSQVVALTSRSSLAALPATYEGARALDLPEPIVTFFIPLSASMFRVGAAMAQTVAVLFLARLYGVALDVPHLATIVVTVVLTSFTVPGVPAGAIITIAPVLQSAGVPVEGIGVLIGVDTIPDMFRTMANVTGWLGGGAILARTRSPSA